MSKKSLDSKPLLEKKRILKNCFSIEDDLRIKTQILDSLPDSIMLMDITGKVIYLNKRAYTAVGYSKEEMIKLGMKGIDAPKDAKLIKQRIQTVLKKKSAFFEVEHIKKDKSIIPVEVRASLIISGKEKYILGVDTDISKRKENEKALIAQKAIAESQLETAIDGVLIVGKDGKIIHFNKRFAELWKLPKNILETKDDKKMMECILKSLKNPTEFTRKVKYLYTHHKEKCRDEIEFVDGRCFDRHSAPFFDNKGQITGRIWRFREITGQKKIESQLRDERNVLENVIDTAQVIILILDISGRVLTFNKHAQYLTGYSEKEVLGKDWFNTFLPPHSQNEAKQLFKKAIGDIQTKVNVGQIITKDGRELLIEWYDKTLKNNDGKVIGLISIGHDVTLRKKAEADMLLKNLILEGQYETSMDGILVWDTDKKIISYNRRFLEIWKIPENIVREQKERLMLVFIISKLKDPDAFSKKLQYLDTHPNKKSFDIVELMDGRIFERYSSPLINNNDNNNLAGRVWFFRDVTNEKLAEAKLKENEKKYRELIENAGDLIQRTDKNGKFIFANRKFKEVMGYADEEISHLDIAQITSADSAKEIRSNFEKLAKGIILKNIELVTLTKKGERLNLIGNVTPIFEGNEFVGATSIFSDVTDRKKAEIDLKKSMKEWKETFDSMADGVSLHDSEFRIVKANKALLNILGIEEQDIIGKKCYTIFHGTTCPYLHCPLEQLIRTRKPETMEFFHEKLKKYFLVSTSPVFEDDGSLINIVHVVRDITAQKAAMSEIEQKNEELSNQAQQLEISNNDLILAQEELKKQKENVEYVVIERTKELKDEKEKVDRLLKLKTDFVNQLSHDLRTPLTPLKILLPIIKEQIKDEELLKKIDICARNVTYLDVLIKETLNLARLDSGRVPLQIKKTDIQKLIAEKIAEKNEVLGVTKLQIINNVKDSIMLYIDPLRISEVLNNLLENARKYMKDDGTVTINSQINKREVIISVEDNGIGMSEDTIKHLFNEFYKADESRHDFSSFGLGLSICKKIIDMHGGKIWVESGGLGKGSTFYFSLPIKADL